MKAVAIVVVVVFLCGALVASCVAVLNDEDTLARIVLVSHDECWEEECGGQDYDGNWSNEDRNRNRNRNRGAFSPGPFDRSPIDFSGSCISLDCSGRPDRERERQAPRV